MLRFTSINSFSTQSAFSPRTASSRLVEFSISQKCWRRWIGKVFRRKFNSGNYSPTRNQIRWNVHAKAAWYPYHFWHRNSNEIKFHLPSHSSPARPWLTRDKNSRIRKAIFLRIGRNHKPLVDSRWMGRKQIKKGITSGFIRILIKSTS